LDEHLALVDPVNVFAVQPEVLDVGALFPGFLQDPEPGVAAGRGKIPVLTGAGGNTRLRILKELWEETGNEKYFRINCKFVPWVDESQVLIDHLSENDNRSDYIFIDRAKGICELYERLESEEEGTLSQRAFISRMLDLGYPKLSRQQLLRFQYAVELYEYIPEALDGGMHLRAIDRLKDLLADLRIFMSAVGSGYPEISEAFDECDEGEVSLLTGETKNLTKGTSLTGEAWAEDTPPMQILRAGGFYPYVRKMIQERGLPEPVS